MSKPAVLSFKEQSFTLPSIEGKEKEIALDIRKLRQKSGLITFDPGYKNTGSAQSAITFLDGERGILRYRGYAIEELAEKSTFLEVAYLLIYGDLPQQDDFEKFKHRITKHTLVHEDVKKILEGFPSHSHPMGILSSLVCAQTAFYPASLDPNRSAEAVNLSIIRLIAKMPTFAAWAYKKEIGHPVVYPDDGFDYCGNFLKMMFALPVKVYELDPIVANALDKILILHADHEQNCSTSTVRLVGSSRASLYASIAAGINALWGPLHGGANQAVIEMLDNILAEGGNFEKYIKKAKDNNDPFRLMGFGHRIYKNFDPRAKMIKKLADEVLAKLGIHDPVLELAKKLEESVRSDEYFIEKKLFPNVDFYSGIIYKAIGIPIEMFTVMFVLGRLPGWIAHWKEMRENNEPIGRPRQIYIGHGHRHYTAIEKRTGVLQ